MVINLLKLFGRAFDFYLRAFKSHAAVAQHAETFQFYDFGRNTLKHINLRINH